MTVKEFYDYCRKKGWEDWEIVHEDQTGAGPDYPIQKRDIDTLPEERQVWL